MNHIDDDRSRKEQEHVLLRQESEEIMRNIFCILDEHKEKDPVGLLNLACLAVLGRDGETQNTFLGLLKIQDGEVDAAKRIYGDFAEMILNDLSRNDGALTEPLQSSDGFVSFAKIIEKNFSVNKFKILFVDLSWPHGTASAASRCLSVIGRLFKAFAYDLAMALDFACRVIYEGVPLYERSIGDGGYSFLTDKELNVYVEKKGELAESGEITDIPSWSKKLFVKESDLLMHSVFFNTGSYDSSREDILIRRNALRNAIGVADDVIAASVANQPQATYRGELLSLTHQVQDKFWHPDRFDASDRDSYPQQTEIIDWIKATRAGISDAEAKAVEKIACPIKR